MPIDFGTVMDYSDRGFGFVGRTFYPGQKVFFHIKTIRRKYPQVAQQIDNDSYSGVGFWYDPEWTGRGDQVGEIWLRFDEIPEPDRREIVPKVKQMLSAIGHNLQSGFEKLAAEVLGPAEYERLRAERESRLREQEAERLRLAQEAELKRREAEAERQRQVAGTGYFFGQASKATGTAPAAQPAGPQQITTRVVGVTFEGRQAVVAQLTTGEQIRLRREPSNPYDRNAIRVERANGQQIGYIGRFEAARYAPRLDACGGVLPAVVAELTGGYSTFASSGLRIRFTLPEAPTSSPAQVRDFDDNWDM